MDSYDAGLLNDFGGGDVEWWQDYIRAELNRAEDFYRDQFDHLTAQLDASRALLAEWDAEIAGYLEIMRIAGVGPHKANYTLGKLTLNGELNVIKQENTTLREEVERLKDEIHHYEDQGLWIPDKEAEVRKQTAQEIIQYIQSGLRRGTVYYVDDTDLKDIKQRYGLEG